MQEIPAPLRSMLVGAGTWSDMPFASAIPTNLAIPGINVTTVLILCVVKMNSNLPAICATLSVNFDHGAREFKIIA